MSAAAAVTLLAALPATPAQAQASSVDLKVLTPRANDSLGSAQFSLDVAFESKAKSPVVTAELWVDGVRWARRDLDAPQIKNVLSFAVDGSSLSAGKHTIVVKVFTAANGVSQVSLPVYAGNNNGEVRGSISGPDLNFKSLANGQKVSGNVEVLLDAKERNGVNPYVTIYVDKQFKTLKNYPPYSYVWDTTKVPNGYHTIEATGYLDANGESSARSLKVFVDNVGGNTEFKSDVPDLGKARERVAPSAVSSAVTPLAIPLPGKTILKPEGEPVSSPVTVAVPQLKMASAELATSSKSVMPLTASQPSVAAPAVRVAAIHTTAERVSVVHPAVTIKASVSASVIKATAAAPTVGVLQSAPLASVSAAMTAAPVSSVSLAAPKMAEKSMAIAASANAIKAAAPVSFSTVTANKTVRRASSTRSNPRAILKLDAHGYLHTANRRNVQLAFNGQALAFDVQPRVEAGLPLAPFRQIFEHSGGQVMWVKETQVVRAVNADREIVIKVGQNKAKVNGETFTMARPAFLEQGRTIVPLSFVGQAMNVDVQYDQASGRLSITSKN